MLTSKSSRGMKIIYFLKKLVEGLDVPQWAVIRSVSGTCPHLDTALRPIVDDLAVGPRVKLSVLFGARSPPISQPKVLYISSHPWVAGGIQGLCKFAKSGENQ